MKPSPDQVKVARAKEPVLMVAGLTMHLLVLSLAMPLSVRAESSSRVDRPPTVAVLQLSGPDLSPSELELLTDRLRIELFRTEKFRVTERDRMNDILQEQGFQISGCVSTECVVQVGQLLAVERIVAGSIGRIGNMYTLNVRLVNVETGVVDRVAVKDCMCSLQDVLVLVVAQSARELGGMPPITDEMSGWLQRKDGNPEPPPRPGPTTGSSRRASESEASWLTPVRQEFLGVTLHAGRSWVKKPYETLPGYVAEFGAIYLGKSGWGGGFQGGFHSFTEGEGFGASMDIVVRYGYRPLFIQGAIGIQETERGDKYAYNPPDPSVESLGGVSLAVGGGLYINKYLGAYAQYRFGTDIRIITVGIAVLAGIEDISW